MQNRVAVVRIADGFYMNRCDLIDHLQSQYHESKGAARRGYRYLLTYFTKLGEPPNSDKGMGGVLRLGDTSASLRFVCSDDGVYFNVVDLIRLFTVRKSFACINAVMMLCHFLDRQFAAGLDYD